MYPSHVNSNGMQQGMTPQGMMSQQGMGQMSMNQGMMPQQGMGQMSMNQGMMPQQGMGMNVGMVPAHAHGHGAQVHPTVIPTKHIVLPVKVSSHHINNTTDVAYDLEFTIEEYFPDGSKAEHKHKTSKSFTELKKVNEAVYHGELVKDPSKLHWPSAHFFERHESDKKVAERMSEMKVYLDVVMQSPKALNDKTFMSAIGCDREFEIHMRHAADYMKMLKKETKKKAKHEGKIKKKAEKETKKEMKKADKHYKKGEKAKEEQYHQALKQQVYTDVHGRPTQGMPMQAQGVPMQGMPVQAQGMPMQGMPMQGMPMQGMPMHAQGMPMQGSMGGMGSPTVPHSYSTGSMSSGHM